MRIVISSALILLPLLLASSISARPKPHTHPLTLKQQLAAKNAVIADLRQQVQYLTGEIENLRNRMAESGAVPGGGRDAANAPGSLKALSYDDRETIIRNKIAAERVVNDRFVAIHGNPPDGDFNKRNPHMDNILAWDQQLIDLFTEELRTLDDPVKLSEKQRMLDEQRGNLGQLP